MASAEAIARASRVRGFLRSNKKPLTRPRFARAPSPQGEREEGLAARPSDLRGLSRYKVKSALPGKLLLCSDARLMFRAIMPHRGSNAKAKVRGTLWRRRHSISAIFRDIFTTRGDAPRVLRREAHRPSISISKRRWRGCRGGSASSRRRQPREIVKQCRIENIDLRQAEEADRAHRLSDPRRGAADRGALRQGARRVVPLGRDHAGHHRHRDGHADPRRAAISSKRTWRRSRRRSPICRGAIATRRWPGAAICSRRCRSPSASRWRRCLRPCSATASGLRKLRPRVLVGEFAGAAGTLSSLGKDGLKVQAALMEELGLGQPEIAWHTVRDRIGEVGCFLGLRHRHARQDLDGREAADADRSRRSVRAVP